MITGQMVFYSGVGLLVLTIIVRPETAVYGDAVSNVTQRLRNGYPTERVTIRREAVQSQPEQGTELIAGEETELLSQTEKLIK